MSISITRVGSGVTLRHWSADGRSFKGGAERPSPPPSGLAEDRRLREVASMLKRTAPDLVRQPV